MSEKGQTEQLLDRIIRAIDRRRREIDGDTGLKQLKVVVRRFGPNGDWVTQVERVSEEPLDR